MAGSCKIKVQKLLLKTSSMQLILVSIFIYFIASILIIYIHIASFLDYRQLSNEPDSTFQLDFDSLSHGEINLISNSVIAKNNFSIRGWWFDHMPFRSKVLCLNSGKNLCSKIFYTECKPDRIRAMYQYLHLDRKERLKEFSVSLKSSANDLKEQNENRTFGLQLQVKLSDDSLQYLSLEMPPNSNDWALKSSTFKCPPNTYVKTITVMLQCFGYSGTVMFTETQIKPVNDLTKVNLDECKSTNQGQFRPTDSDHYRIEPLQFQSDLNTTSSAPDEITLVTHVSINRIQILDKTLKYWHGPVSLMIHVPLRQMNETLLDWQRLYLHKKLRTLRLNTLSSLSLVYSPEDPAAGYPINLLRNKALDAARTRFVLQIDADFVPCPDIETRLRYHLSESARRTSIDMQRTAFVLPAFEFIEAPSADESFAKSKEELLQLIFRDDPLIQPFRLVESPDSHKLTNYWKWYSSEQSYPVISYSDKYEPYLVVVKHDAVPRFDDRFTGYGMNKITFIAELYAARYRFEVLPDVWITHLPHRLSTYSQHFLQNIRQRIKNRALRFDFICSLISRYRL